jgi:hypothetical protein
MIEFTGTLLGFDDYVSKCDVLDRSAIAAFDIT